MKHKTSTWFNVQFHPWEQSVSHLKIIRYEVFSLSLSLSVCNLDWQPSMKINWSVLFFNTCEYI